MIDTIIKKGIQKFSASYPVPVSTEIKDFLISQGSQYEEDLKEKLKLNEITEEDIENQIYTILELSLELMPHAARKRITVNDLQKAMKAECKVFPWC